VLAHVMGEPVRGTERNRARLEEEEEEDAVVDLSSPSSATGERDRLRPRSCSGVGGIRQNVWEVRRGGTRTRSFASLGGGVCTFYTCSFSCSGLGLRFFPRVSGGGEKDSTQRVERRPLRVELYHVDRPPARAFCTKLPMDERGRPARARQCSSPFSPIFREAEAAAAAAPRCRVGCCRCRVDKDADRFLAEGRCPRSAKCMPRPSAQQTFGQALGSRLEMVRSRLRNAPRRCCLLVDVCIEQLIHGAHRSLGVAVKSIARDRRRRCSGDVVHEWGYSAAAVCAATGVSQIARENAGRKRQPVRESSPQSPALQYVVVLHGDPVACGRPGSPRQLDTARGFCVR